MKTITLITNMLIFTSTGLFAQSQGDMDTLNARLDLNEAKIKQLENELAELKYHRSEKAAVASVANVPVVQKAAEVTTAQYTVKKGDILTRIAHKHNTTVAQIKKANGLKNDSLSIGQKLTMPSKHQEATKAVAEKPAPAQTPVAKKASSPSKHVTKRGETFYSIARLHNIKLSSLIAANPNIHPSRLSPGQVLTINGNAKAAAKSTPTPPKAKTAQTSKPKAKVASTPTPAPAPSPAVKETAKVKEVASQSAAKSEGSPIRTITVYEQMTYGQFASKHGASTNQLNALNGLSLNNNTVLAKGSELYVPQYQ